MAITLEHIKVNSGEYMRPLWTMYFKRNWMWFMLPLLACGVAGMLHDVRWFIVGLMILFMFFPMFMVLIYLNYALTLEVRWSLMEKTVTMDETGLHLSFTDSRMKPRLIAWNGIKKVTHDDKYYYFHLVVRRYNYLMVPREQIVSQGVNERDVQSMVLKNIHPDKA